MIAFDATNNRAQQRLHFEVCQTLSGGSNSFFAVGGGIRGGKTFGVLAEILLLARKFPKFRAHIVRDSLGTLKLTTIPSFLKLLPDGWGKWHRYDAEYYFELPNSSRIYFLGEGFDKDPELSKFKGLETNAIFLEQIEELQEETLQKAFERAGSWYIDPMPPPFIFATFNPCQNWVKDTIYTPWAENKLPDGWVYIPALASDNPFVTEAQKQNWKQMDDLQYKRFVLGDWEAVDRTGKFAYNFNNSCVEFCVNTSPKLWLSFDFNLSPLTCIVAEVTTNKISILAEYAVEEPLEALCDRIKRDWSQAEFTVTGDPAGKAGSVLVRKNVNAYYLIRERLRLPLHAFQLLKKAPTHENSYYFFNALITKRRLEISPKCVGLINDLRTVRYADGQIDKSGNKGHLLDCLRYLLHINAK